MLIVGSKGHSKEILQLLVQKGNTNDICFYDDVSKDIGKLIYNQFPILKSIDEAHDYFLKINSKFILGLGYPKVRHKLAKMLEQNGGILTSIISDSAKIGNYNTELGYGINVMNFVMISNDVRIGEGSLINSFVSVHHDVVIGDYCEVSPHASLLGGCHVGDYTSIGANATILPKIKVGKKSIIGAGAVVTKDIPDGCIAIGVPANVIKLNE